MRSARLPAVLSDACSFTAGLATALVQVVLVRELFGVLEGHEVSVALSLAVWVAGIACGALAGARLAARARIGEHRRGVIEHEAVLVAVVQGDGCCEPAAAARLERNEPETRAVQLHPFTSWRPHLDHARPSPTTDGVTSRATG